MPLAQNTPFQGAPNASGLPCGPTYDYFILAGVQTPGKATLLSCDAAQGWDVRKGNALNWATVVPTGQELCKPVFQVEIWTADQWDAWLTLAAGYLARPAPNSAGTTASRAMGFWHGIASAAPYFVTAVLVEKVTTVKQGDGIDSALFTIQCHFIEFRAPLPAPPRPTQAASPVTPPTPTAQNANQQAIQANQARIASLLAPPPAAPPGQAQ